VNRSQEKARSQTGQDTGRSREGHPVPESERRVGEAESGRSSAHHSDQGIVKDGLAQEQPKDEDRAQTAHKTESEGSVSKHERRNPKRGWRGDRT
jgi:hypothetical protein